MKKYLIEALLVLGLSSALFATAACKEIPEANESAPAMTTPPSSAN